MLAVGNARQVRRVHVLGWIIKRVVFQSCGMWHGKKQRQEVVTQRWLTLCRQVAEWCCAQRLRSTMAWWAAALVPMCSHPFPTDMACGAEHSAMNQHAPASPAAAVSGFEQKCPGFAAGRHLHPQPATGPGPEDYSGHARYGPRGRTLPSCQRH